MIKLQHGIALIQVLLISAIISVLALYMSVTAKQQVHIAQKLIDKNEALIDSYDAEAQMLFTLLTTFKKQDNTLRGIENDWNFYGKEFHLFNNTSITIQDNAGLLDLNFLDQNITKKWLLANGYSNDDVSIIIDSLIDWQDKDSLAMINGAEENYYDNLGYAPRNGPMYLIRELNLIRGFSPALVELFESTVTIYKGSYFNPLNAPNHLLAALYPESGALLEKRNNNAPISINEFQLITGEQMSENLMFFTSRYLTLTITSKVNKSKVMKKLQFKLDSYQENDNKVLVPLSLVIH